MIPRWAMSSIKENGKLIEVNELNAKRIQSDLKGDFICESCEKKMKPHDDFSALFYRDKSYKKQDIELKGIGIEEHSEDAKIKLKYFIVSVVLRYEVYLRVIEKMSGQLGPMFNSLKEHFNNSTIETSSFDLVTFCYSEHDKLHAFPWKDRQDGLNCIETMLFGYRSTLFTDRRGGPKEYNYITSQPSLLIVKIDGIYNAFSKHLTERAKKIGPIHRK